MGHGESVRQQIVERYMKVLSEVSGIRIEKLSLTQKLHTELGLNRVEIHAVLARTAFAMGIDMHIEDGSISEATSLELISLLVQWSKGSYAPMAA